MTNPSPNYLPVPAKDAVAHITLPAIGHHKETQHILDRPSALAVNAALAAERPLLVRGEPGTGKSQLARAAAVALGRRFLVNAVDARTETRDLLYVIDAVSRLAHAQLAGARNASENDSLAAIDVARFVHPGPLWWAYDSTSAREQATTAKAPIPDGADGEGVGVVLLIDEIDKADPTVPNGLLDAFGGGRFAVEGRSAQVHAQAPYPLVILTTNEERALPDAFVRRCLVLHMELPRLPEQREQFVDTLITRGKANLDGCHPDVLGAAAQLIADDRIELRKHGVCLPGVAEYIDLLRAVTTLATGKVEQVALLHEVKALATRKHPLERVG